MVDYVRDIAGLLSERGWMLATAESCTGGGIAEVLTDLPGASQWFDRGFVTYSNLAKHEMLGVSNDTLATHGAVSEETVTAMAWGAIAHSDAQVSVAVSGVAGPDGGTPEKPVGTVWIGWAWTPDEAVAQCFHFDGGRRAVREQTIAEALKGLVAHLEK